MSYSIIIPAYKAEDYIEECLNSCILQDIDNNYEIIVGIDGCEKTRNEIDIIKKKFATINFYFMEENKGVFVTINTLVSLATFDNIVIFGADDIMNKNLLSIIDNNIENGDIVRYRCENFEIIKGRYKPISKTLPHGAVTIKRKVFEKLGGFRDWRCAADTDFLNRSSGFKTVTINDVLFKRRIHKESLTNNKETKHGSVIRNKYKKMLSKKFEYVEPIFHRKINRIN